MKVSEMPNSELEKLIRMQIITLLKDAGLRYTEDEMRHIISRIPDVLISKFNYLDFDVICEAWEKGSTGQYGLTTKINVNNLVSWIYTKVKEIQEINRFKNTDELKYFEWSEQYASTFGMFLNWLRKECEIYPQDIDPEHDPEKTKKVSPILRQLQERYDNSKNNLTALKTELIYKYQ